MLRDRLDKRSGATLAYGFDVPGVDLHEVDQAYRILGEQMGALHSTGNAIVARALADFLAREAWLSPTRATALK